MRILLPVILALSQLVLASIEARAQSQIKHVVIVFQENRSTDNMFHGLPGADIADTGVNSKGEIITLKEVPLTTKYDLFHYHSKFVAMYNNGKMDGADKTGAKCGWRFKDCFIPPNPQFKYVRQADIQPYFDMAQQYTFGDRMFQTNQGPSYGAHQYIIAGTSIVRPDSDLYASDIPLGPHHADWVGCGTPMMQWAPVLDPTGDDSTVMYPCWEHATLMDLLDAAGVSWRHYSWGLTSNWVGPNSIYHMRWGPQWANMIPDPAQVLTDIQAGQLPAVSWVMPKGSYSDHPGGNLGQGPSWVASIVNAIGNSPYWADTAIIVTWDDWGGWYDHVPPPSIYNQNEYGFRVPLIVISPYAKPGYVSHVTHDFGSILHFVETVFGLPSLGYADARADDLADCFDFTQTPIKFRTIAAPLDANFFLNDTTPGDGPDE